MTRRIVADTQRKWRARTGSRVRQQLGYVAYLPRQSCCPLTPRWIVLEQMAVVLHHRSAARGIDSDHVRARGLERFDVPPCKSSCALQISRVRVERPAAALSPGRSDGVAVHLEHALRCTICLSEQS